VLWGGREGYETLLNTDMKRELDQLGRFLNMVVEHKHTIGFDGTLLIEPKPVEPTKHQYDYDVATVFAFLQRYGLEHEIKVNIEVNHATLSGHDFHHEVATAVNAGIFGSIDANAGDDRLGWDLDLFHGHVGGMDTMARSLLAAASILEDGELDTRRAARYAGWLDRTDILNGEVTLQQLHDAQMTGAEPVGVSGRQEALENLVARHIGRAR